MKAAVYLRVSTDRQDERNQEPDCLRVCAARGWEPVLFRETESGAKKRPVWEQVKGAAHRGEVGAVVIWAIDRAGRDRVTLAADFRKLAHQGLMLVSVREAWLDQPAGPMRDLLIEILGWFAETERARLRERTRAGLARARALGKHIGRKWTPPEKVAELRGMFEAGRMVGFAARESGLPKSTVRTYWRRWEAEGANLARLEIAKAMLEGGATKGAAFHGTKTAENQGE